MSVSPKNHNFFCLYASSTKDMGDANNMSNVVHYLNNAIKNPLQAEEFEVFAETVLRNNGFDPNHDRGWVEAGLPGGRAEAVQKIRQAYLNAVPKALQKMEERAQADPYDCVPSVLLTDNPLKHLAASFSRAHQGKNMADPLNNEAWQETGVASIEELQKTVRDIFVKAGVGGYFAHVLKVPDTKQNYALSIQAADYAIYNAFPELAQKLEVPQPTKAAVRAPSNLAPSGFGKPTDCQPH